MPWVACCAAVVLRCGIHQGSKLPGGASGEATIDAHQRRFRFVIVAAFFFATHADGETVDVRAVVLLDEVRKRGPRMLGKRKR